MDEPSQQSIIWSDVLVLTRRFLLALSFFALAICANATDASEIRGGSEQDFRPYSFVENDVPTGFGVELLRAVAEKATLSVSITPGEWDKLWNELVNGKIDVLPVVARTPGREGLVEFTLPHTETFDAFFVRTGQPQIRSLTEAAGKEILVLRSDAAHHQLVERQFTGKIIPVDSIPDGLRLIASGEHDAMLCSRLIGVIERNQAGIKGVTDGPVIPDYKRVFSFAVRKGNTELVERLNQGLLLVQADGTYDQLYRKWLGIPVESQSTWWDFFWRIAAIVFLLALLAAMFGIGRKLLLLEAPSEVQPHFRLETVWRYSMAPLAAMAALILQFGVLRWVGPILPNFILFYPIVMIVAVIAGMGPGLLTTALAVVAESIWMMPVGHWAVPWSDLIALAIFAFNGSLVCTLAELYRRTRSKAAAHERDQAVRESEERLRMQRERMPIGCIVYDEHNCFSQVNPAAEKIFGYSENELLGQHARFIVPDLTRPHVDSIMRRLAEGDMTAHSVNENLTKDDRTILCEWTNTPLRDATGRHIGFLSMVQDITQRKQAEEALKRSEVRWNAAIENFAQGAIIATEDEQIIYWNPAAREMHGIAGPDEFIEPLKKTPFTFELWTPDGGHKLELNEWPMRRIKRGGAVKNLEFRVRCPNQGWEKVFSYSGTMVETAAGERLIFLTCHDLTELRQAEEELGRLNENLEKLVQERTEKLRRLAIELTLVEQRERKQLGRILHDGLQQYLVAAKMQVNRLVSSVNDECVRQSASEIENLLGEAFQISRNLAAELSPPILQHAGLVAALEWLARWNYQKHGMKVILTNESEDPNLAEDVKSLVFESVRELLLNVVKHSGVKEAKIRICRTQDNRLQVTVDDKGKGFNPVQVTACSIKDGSGFGMFSIRERIQLIGGEFEADSTPGKGAEFTMTVPVSDDLK
jgi:PAS domain S-box-containing protein